jgi:hypothetical protein
VGDTERPVTDGYIQLYQRPAGHGYYDLPSDQRLPNPNDWRNAVAPLIVAFQQLDANGRFEVFVGPGTYYAFGSDEARHEVFELADQSQFEMNLRAKPQFEGMLVGRVVGKDSPDQGISGANVFGQWNRPMAVTDENGTFEVKRFDEDVLCGVFTDDLKFGTLKMVNAGSESVKFELTPTVTLRGTLIDDETGRPAAKEEIRASIRINGEGDTFSMKFGRSSTTATDGTFEIVGIVPGQLYDFDVVRERDARGMSRSWTFVGEFTAAEVAVINVGELRLPALNQPVTTEDRIARAFDGQDHLADRLTQRFADAELAYQQILLLVADPEAESIQQVFEARYDNA